GAGRETPKGPVARKRKGRRSDWSGSRQDPDTLPDQRPAARPPGRPRASIRSTPRPCRVTDIAEECRGKLGVRGRRVVPILAGRAACGKTPAGVTRAVNGHSAGIPRAEKKKKSLPFPSRPGRGRGPASPAPRAGGRLTPSSSAGRRPG